MNLSWFFACIAIICLFWHQSYVLRLAGFVLFCFIAYFEHVGELDW